MKTTQTTAMMPIGRLQRPSCHGPGSNASPCRSRRNVGQHVGDVEADDGDRGDGGVGGRRSTGTGSPSTKAPPAASQMALVGVRVRPLIRCQNAETRERAVAGERVDHPRVRGHRGHAAEELGHDHDQQQQLPAGVADGVDEDLGRRHTCRRVPIALVVALDREGEADQQDPAGDHRDDDRHHDAARAGPRPRRASPRSCAPRRRTR